MIAKVTAFLAGICLLSAGEAEQQTHLFVLSGQSNMVGLNPELSFTPRVKSALSGDEVIVVKDAAGGQPIRRWHKKWQPPQRSQPTATGDLYDRLMTKVNAAIVGKQIDTVTFIWMQGERDAREQYGEVYADSLKGLVEQISNDLKHKNINVVIGRLSDFDNANKRYPHWTRIREAQVQSAQSNSKWAWVDTDDLNGSRNGLHYTKEGYVELGRRFAEKSIALIKQQ